MYLFRAKIVGVTLTWSTAMVSPPPEVPGPPLFPVLVFTFDAGFDPFATVLVLVVPPLVTLLLPSVAVTWVPPPGAVMLTVPDTTPAGISTLVLSPRGNFDVADKVVAEEGHGVPADLDVLSGDVKKREVIPQVDRVR
jgi:hypothetical protein